MLTSIARDDENDGDPGLAALMPEDAARFDEYLDHVRQAGEGGDLATNAAAPGAPDGGPRRRTPHAVGMVRRPVPTGGYVLDGSTPVVAFGDPDVAEVATLGMNPSAAEFLDGGSWLSGDRRRLATLESLHSGSPESLTDEQVSQVVDDCVDYFHRHPNSRWFNPLNHILRWGLGVSYYDDTACHLDLVQWATDPIWEEIPDRDVQRLLLDDGVGHLRRQLEAENVRLVVVNGQTVWDELAATGLATFHDVGHMSYGDSSWPVTLREGEGAGVRFLGWTLNAQGSFGVRREDWDALADWLRRMTMEAEPARTQPAAVSGHLARTTVHSKAQFTDLLRRWVQGDPGPTVGDVGGSSGGTWVLRLALPSGQTASLNSDTKKEAVLAYLEQAAVRGAQMPWRLLADHDGVVHKLDFAVDGPPVPGWYCYLDPPRQGAW
jgi:hypothetical protein